MTKKELKPTEPFNKKVIADFLALNTVMESQMFEMAQHLERKNPKRFHFAETIFFIRDDEFNA